MGVYIFDTDVLVRALEADADQPTSHDFGKDIIPALIHQVPVFAYRFYDENKKAVEVLARHRHARRVLRSQHGSLPRESGVQSLRSGVAAAHLPAAGAAGEVRVRRTRHAAAARRSTR